MRSEQLNTADYERYDSLSRQLLIAKFKSFAKEKFLGSVRYEINSIDFIKESAKHFSIKLPANIGEFFIRLDAAPFYWICDSPVIQSAESLIKPKNKIISTNNFEDIKKFYSKWIMQKGDKDKQYFALSTLNLIERNTDKQNFLKNILYATVLSFDKTITSFDKAIQLMSEAEEILGNSNADNELKNEILYLINLFTGFIYLKDNLFEEANEKFTSAQIYKSPGITAIFYNAKTQSIIGNRERCAELLNELIDFDKSRFNYAVSFNALNLLNFFMSTAVMLNIFTDTDFAEYLPEIEIMMNAPSDTENDILSKLQIGLTKLEELNLNSYFDENIKPQIEFLNSFINTYKENKNLLISFSTEILPFKFADLLTQLTENIRTKAYQTVQASLEIFDEQIKDNEDHIKYLQREVKEIKSKYDAQLEKSIKSVEAGVNDTIAAVEYRVENLDSNKKYDPASAFNNTMVYNVIISLIIFIIGGFASGFVDSFQSGDNSADIFFDTIMSGAKWGGLTFILGLLVAMFSAVSSVWEKSNEKQRLIKMINHLKLQRDRQIKIVKEDHIRKMKSFEENHQERLKELEKEIEFLKEEKKLKAEHLEKEAEKEVSEISQKVNEMNII